MKERFKELYWRRCGLLYGALTLALVLCTLFAGDDVGLSDNGDFGRVMAASSLNYGTVQPNFTYVDTYTIDLSRGSAAYILLGTEGLARYPSVHVLLVRASVAVNLVLNKLTGGEMSLYRIGVLGTMHALLYAGAIGLLLSQFRLRRLWQDVLVKAAALLALCDLGYVAYFNSLYSEGLEHIALVLCAAMLLRALTRQPTLWDGVWCAGAGVLYGWSKFFNIPIAILAVLVMEGAVLVRTRLRQALAFGGAALAMLLTVWAAMPGWMDTETNYNAVFYGVIRDVDEAEAARCLADLGLPEELTDYRDTNYYLSWVIPTLEQRGLREAAESVDKGDLLKFYLTHPGRLWRQAQLTALHCGMLRPYYLANYGAGYPLMSCSDRMAGWSALRDWLALDTVAGNLAVAVAFFVMVIVTFRRRTRPLWLALPLLALAGALAYAFLLPVVLNGEGDFAKHMFAYMELADLLLLACLGLAVDRAGRGRMGGVVCPAAGAALALALVLPPIGDLLAQQVQTSQAHTSIEPGAYVTLGSYEGRPLTWLAAEGTEDGLLLLCADEGITMVFDVEGENDWRTSTVRAWLNGAFLEGFTPAERALLRVQDNTVLLADRYRDEAVSGYLDFGCSHIAPLAARGYDRALLALMSDIVTLPDIDLIARLAQAGRTVAGRDYWLEAPYCRTVELVRYAAADGHVYFGPAAVPRVVRPVVKLGPAQAVSGSGSRDDPFILAY